MKKYAGRIVAVPAVLMLLMSSYFKFFPNQEALEGMAKSGIPQHVVPIIGVLEVFCTLLFLIPQTAVLGAILLTGYLGGAIFAHVRMQESFLLPLVFGVLLWASLFLRDERVRKLIPFRKNTL